MKLLRETELWELKESNKGYVQFNSVSAMNKLISKVDEIIKMHLCSLSIYEGLEEERLLLRSNALVAKWLVQFRKHRLKYLNHIVTCEGVATDPSKVVVLQEWLILATMKQLRGFWDSPGTTVSSSRVTES